MKIVLVIMSFLIFSFKLLTEKKPHTPINEAVNNEDFGIYSGDLSRGANYLYLARKSDKKCIKRGFVIGACQAASDRLFLINYLCRKEDRDKCGFEIWSYRSRRYLLVIESLNGELVKTWKKRSTINSDPDLSISDYVAENKKRYPNFVASKFYFVAPDLPPEEKYKFSNIRMFQENTGEVDDELGLNAFTFVRSLRWDPEPDPPEPPPAESPIVDLSKDFELAPDYKEHPINVRLSNLFENLTNAEESKKVDRIKSVVVLEKGKVIYEFYKPGPTLHSQAGAAADVPQHVNSTTKSWINAIFGIMEKRGEINLDDTLDMISKNPKNESRKWSAAVWDEVKAILIAKGKDSSRVEWIKKITVRSLLSMTSGFKSLELIETPAQTLWEMAWLRNTVTQEGGTTSAKSITYADYLLGNLHDLERCMEETAKGPTDVIGVKADGSRCRRWDYMGAGNLLSFIILQKTGLTPLEYARLHLFSHLGFLPPWVRTKANASNPEVPAGIELFGRGLTLTARQHAKLGQIFLQNGKSSKEKESLFKEDWVKRSTTKSVWHKTADKLANYYGFLFKVNDTGQFYYSQGAGGQNVYVIPEREIVVAVISKFIVKYNIAAIIKNLLDHAPAHYVRDSVLATPTNEP